MIFLMYDIRASFLYCYGKKVRWKFGISCCVMNLLSNTNRVGPRSPSEVRHSDFKTVTFCYPLKAAAPIWHFTPGFAGSGCAHAKRHPLRSAPFLPISAKRPNRWSWPRHGGSVCTLYCRAGLAGRGLEISIDVTKPSRANVFLICASPIGFIQESF